MKNKVVKQTPIPILKPLNDIPTDINGWKSYDLSLKRNVISMLGVDDYLFRVYQKNNKKIYVYVGYYEEQREGSLIHSPKHCFYGEGFYILKSEKVEIKTKNGNVIHATKMIIGKYLEKKMVLYWYQSGEKTISSDFVAKFHLITKRILKRNSSGALIRIVAGLDSNEQKVFFCQKEFIDSFYPYLLRSFGH